MFSKWLVNKKPFGLYAVYEWFTGIYTSIKFTQIKFIPIVEKRSIWIAKRLVLPTIPWGLGFKSLWRQNSAHDCMVLHLRESFNITFLLSWYDLNNYERDIKHQGPVVQSTVSLTSSLVVKMLTVLSTVSNSQVFLLKKKCKSYSHFFSKNIRVYAIFNDQFKRYVN